MATLEFVVFGTPVSAQASKDTRRFWKQRIHDAALVTASAIEWTPPDAVALRVAYFYVDAPAADLDNILKLIQDALHEIAYDDDIRVIDLVASMRPKSVSGIVSMPSVLAAGFRGNSDFVYVNVQGSTGIEVLR